MKSAKNTYFILVIIHLPTDKIIASGSIVLERKFLRGAGTIGHIEDIAVNKALQGRKLGLRLISALEGVGRGMGCYKIILDCSKDNIGESNVWAVGLQFLDREREGMGMGMGREGESSADA